MTRTNNTNLKDVWQTPDKITDMLQPIDLDPCAGIDTDIGRDKNLKPDDNGLTSEWHGRVFVNPPFSEKELWLQKTLDEKRNTEVIMVTTPDSTDTKSWWHKYIAGTADYIWFSKGRISYIVPEEHADEFPKYDAGTRAYCPTFGTAISIFGEPGEKTLKRLQNNGQLLQSYEP